jgi:hypothetical protein
MTSRPDESADANVTDDDGAEALPRYEKGLDRNAAEPRDRSHS